MCMTHQNDPLIIQFESSELIVSICDMETLELRFKELWTVGRSSSNL